MRWLKLQIVVLINWQVGYFGREKCTRVSKLFIPVKRGESEAEVKRKFNKVFEEAIRMGTISETWKTSEFLTHWLETYKKPLDYRKERLRNKESGGRVSASTYSRMLQTYKTQLQGSKAGKLLLRKQLHTIKPEDVQALINELERSGLADSTVKKAQNFLSAAFNIAVKNGYMRTNPALLVTRNGLVSENLKEKVGILTKQDIKLFFEEALRLGEDGSLIYPYGAGAALQLATGCRSGEIRALGWEDVTSNAINIRHSVSWVQNLDEGDDSGKKRVVYISNTKSRASRRSIPYGEGDNIDKCLKILKQRCKGIPNKNNLVLPTSKGGYLTPNNYNKEINKILDKCELDSFASHSLRHSFISLLVNDANCDLATVASLVGHGDIRVTLHYANHTDNDKKMETLSAISRLSN